MRKCVIHRNKGMINHKCINCIFLRTYDDDGRDVEFFQNDRNKLKIENNTAHASKIECCRGIWKWRVIEEKKLDSNTFMLIDEIVKEVFEDDREDFCFFYPYKAGVLLEGAIELQKQAQLNKQLKEEIRRSNRSIRIAAGGLILTVVLSVISLILEYSSFRESTPIRVEIIQPKGE